jgi:mono/diheme cytochrome c family protein
VTDEQLTVIATMHLAGLTDGDALDLLPLLRAVAQVERERCARICEEVEDQAWALWNTMADPHEQGRSLGASHCAQAIRAAE